MYQFTADQTFKTRRNVLLFLDYHLIRKHHEHILQSLEQEIHSCLVFSQLATLNPLQAPNDQNYTAGV